MASPAMLRGVLGRSFKGWHIPEEILEELFKFGFHLWLAVPCDTGCLVEEEDIYREVRTTRMCVPHRRLTVEAERLVEFEEYQRGQKIHWDSLCPPRPARPLILRCNYEIVSTYDITDAKEDKDTGASEWAIVKRWLP